MKTILPLMILALGLLIIEVCQKEPELDWTSLENWYIFDELKSDAFIDSIYHNPPLVLRYEADSADISFLNEPPFGNDHEWRIDAEEGKTVTIDFDTTDFTQPATLYIYDGDTALRVVGFY